MKTERTLLRNFESGDLPDLFEYCSQPGVGEAAGWKHHTSLKETRQTLQTYLENKDVFAIVYKPENKVIGHIAIHPDSETHLADVKELGFVLNRAYQNRGIMSEVIRVVLGYLFNNGISRVYACCFQENLPSKHLIEKSGFILEQEGTFFSSTLNQTFLSFEYVYTRERWQGNDQTG
ncbi:MAG: GNAT family protein [Anaerolineaceae bacterium]